MKLKVNVAHCPIVEICLNFKIASHKLYIEDGELRMVKVELFSQEEHTYTHGAADPELLSNDRGFFAVKWSFAGLMITSLFQGLVFFISGSTALLMIQSII